MSTTHRPGPPGSTLDDQPPFTENAMQTAGHAGHGRASGPGYLGMVNRSAAPSLTTGSHTTTQGPGVLSL
jgi:hypothetical protein